MLFEIPYAEILISDGCNLHCDGCQNYSNYGFKGNLDASKVAEDLREWSERISPASFQILGGEPLLHPDLSSIIHATAKSWPHAYKIVVTNGLLIERRQDIINALLETDTALKVSIHSNDPKYLDRLRDIYPELRRLMSLGVRVGIADYREFFRTYRGVGKYMRPHNHNPSESWRDCSAKNCLNIYNSRLWKCQTISQLRKPLEKFSLLDHSDWKPYLDYQGLPLTASDDELSEFLSRESEEICSICPDKKINYQKDVFSLDFSARKERIEVDFPQLDFEYFISGEF